MRAETTGRDLACWCPPGPWHADVPPAVAGGRPQAPSGHPEDCARNDVAGAVARTLRPVLAPPADCPVWMVHFAGFRWNPYAAVPLGAQRLASAINGIGDAAHTGLGRAHHARDQLALARQHYQEALTLYTDLGVPDADQIRAYLATIDDNSRGPRGDRRLRVAFREGPIGEGNRHLAP